jgi:hypothetical protein
MFFFALMARLSDETRPPRQSGRELLEEAAKLSSLGFHEAAATRVRLVLELVVRSHLHALNAWPGKSRATAGLSKLSLYDMICTMYHAGAISSVERNRLSQCNKVLSRVVHGDRVSPMWVRRMVEAVGDLYSSIGRDWNGLEAIACLPGLTMGAGVVSDFPLLMEDLLA